MVEPVVSLKLIIRRQTARALDHSVHTINWTGAKSICNFCCPLTQIQTHNKLELLKTFHLIVSLIVFFIRWIHFCTLCALWRSSLTFKNLYFHDKFLKHSRYDKIKMEEISRISYFAREKKIRALFWKGSYFQTLPWCLGLSKAIYTILGWI